jgi:hypothetical protein
MIPEPKQITESIKFAQTKSHFQVGDSIYFPGRPWENPVTIYKEENEPKEFKHDLYILLARHTQGIIVDMLPSHEAHVVILTTHGKYITHCFTITHTTVTSPL